MIRSTTLLFTVGLLLGLLSCHERAEEPRPYRAAVELRDAQGQLAWSLRPYGHGYQLFDRSGQRVANLRVRPDRVKAKDTAGREITQASRRDYGFKLKDADDTTVFRARRLQGGFALEREGGTLLARLQGSGATTGITHITLAPAGSGVVAVQRDGATVMTITGLVPPQAAVVLGMTELTMVQRVTAMIYLMEVER